MQRVRIGLTGLAVVFLLVVLAAAIIGTAGRETDFDDGASETSAESLAGGEASSEPPAPPKEPLAELGIAPGNVPGSENAEEVKPTTAVVSN